MKSLLILVKTLVCSQVTCNTTRECKYKPDRKYENRQDRETNDVAHCFKIDMLDSSCFAWLTRSSTWLTRCKIKHRTPCLRNFTTPSKLLRRQSPRYIDYEFSRQWFHVFSFWKNLFAQGHERLVIKVNMFTFMIELTFIKRGFIAQIVEDYGLRRIFSNNELQ